MHATNRGEADAWRLDLAQVVHCSGSLISALLDAGAQNYLEFRLVQEWCANAHACAGHALLQRDMIWHVRIERSTRGVCM
jgi:hypothetical protein